MKLLGIDYGDKRIGIAVANDEQKIALPLGAVRDINELQKIISQERPDKIIIGLPLDSKGRQTKQAKVIKQAVKTLNHYKIEFMDESFTTKTAQGQKDKSAAVQILQDWLDMIE